MYPTHALFSDLPVGTSALDSYILSQVQDVLFVVDPEHFRIRLANPAALRYFELDPDAVLGRRISELVSFDLSDISIDDIIGHLTSKGRWHGELPCRTPSGMRYYFEFTVSRLPDENGLPAGYLAIGRDRSAERRSDENLQRRERFYHGLIADALDGILLLDPSGTITFASPSIRHVLGFEFQEVLGRNAFEFVHPDDRIKAAESFALEVTQNPVIKFITVRLRCKDGSWLWCLVRGHNLLSNPNVGGIAVYFHDDTQRKKAAEALRESEQRFRMLVDSIQFGIIVHDQDLRSVLCNETAAHLLGVERESMLGCSWDESNWEVHSESGVPLDRDEFPVAVAMRSGEPVRDFVIGYQQPGGERLWLLVNSRPVCDDAGAVQQVITSFVDISGRKELEKQLLAGQVAHQRALTQATIDSSEKERTEIGKELHDNIGQQLTTIKLYLDLARSTADEETSEMVSLATRNISDVINDIRALCRNLIPSTLGDLGLEESVNDLIHTLTRTQQLRIRFVATGFDEERVPDNQKLMLFRILQEQLNNIVKHAGARKVTVQLRQGDGELRLEVTDDGCGFDPLTVRRGLGLTNMRNRAEMFGGNVSIVSAPGAGCTLTVSVPETSE
ncbi:PAS domain-containing sensor histidine kinase [Flaviaesturariibacter terrae]